MERYLEFRIDEQTTELKMEAFLKKNAGLTKRQISQAKFRPDGITRNGVRCRVTETIYPGDVICVCLEEAGTASAHLENYNDGIKSKDLSDFHSNKASAPVSETSFSLNILYEDKDILVCHKPAGLAVQNARVGSMDMESLLKNYIAQKVPGKMPYLGIIHRLDQPVEGVLVFALNPKAAADLSRQMTAGKIKKTYLAVTEGTVKVKSAKLVDWLKKDGRTNSSAVVEGGTSGAKKAILSYEVLETWKNKEDAQDCGERNLIRIDLDTGRHHQIRVQMAHAGMPLVGDRKYNPGQNSQEPLALCSAKLGFQHPVTKKQLEFQVQPAGMAFKRH